jgi:hypothetical protein
MPLIPIITYIIYTELNQNILLHLDGNKALFDQFIEITLSRGLLRLDLVANLLFFTTFFFILISDPQT